MTTKTPTHTTPTPWIVKPLGKHLYIEIEKRLPSQISTFICDMQLEDCTEPGERKRVYADAAHIVRCVNEREELLNALRASIEALRSYQYGNCATDLARDVADSTDHILTRAEREEG